MVSISRCSCRAAFNANNISIDVNNSPPKRGLPDRKGYKHWNDHRTLNSTTGIDRLEGYRKAILEQGWVVDETLIVEGDFSEKSGYTAMRRLLEAKPEGCVRRSDIMAIGAIRAVQEAGLCVPQDIAFVGFDDLPIASQSGLNSPRSASLSSNLAPGQ
jgi:hypothetical protein